MFNAMILGAERDTLRTAAFNEPWTSFPRCRCDDAAEHTHEFWREYGGRAQQDERSAVLYYAGPWETLPGSGAFRSRSGRPPTSLRRKFMRDPLDSGQRDAYCMGMSKPNNIPTDINDRAAALALSSCKAFLECLAVGRLPGVKNARRARKLADKAFQQHRRAAALLGVA